MSKVAVLGDLHLDGKNSSLIFLEHIKKFFELFFFPYLLANNIKTIIQVGDIFDRRKNINFNILYVFRKCFFDKLEEYDIKMITILGNHDIYFKESLKVNSPELLLYGYKNIEIITVPTERKIEETTILFLPWICDKNSQECMDAVKKSSATHLVAHLDVAGYEMQKGILSMDGLRSEIFENFDLVITGHFHKMSYVSNIYYIGMPYQKDWGDHNDIKGIHVLDTETKDFTFIKNEFELFYKIHYDDIENPTQYKDNFNKVLGSYVKVIVRNKSNPYSFDLFIDALEKAGAYDIKVVEDHLNLDLQEDETILENVEDTATILNKVVDSLDQQINKHDLKVFLNSLFLEAQNRE